MTAICAERRQNYDSYCPTSFDDIAAINQLDMTFLSLHMRVKLWEQEHDLVLPAESSKKKKAIDYENSYDEANQLASNPAEQSK